MQGARCRVLDGGCEMHGTRWRVLDAVCLMQGAIWCLDGGARDRGARGR
jgi:hypothetical protein